ncbi:MAG: MFS transporter [Proteobacteria bacterium]|nr:MFS transporter [Pseudomonadota bacterium]MBU1688273.1 MFS transporter [Pseudomonadota bacterium]
MNILPSFKAGSGTWRRLPTGIWALGFGSLFMDISSELIHSLLPVFMVSVLGASVVTVGILEGVAEATAAIMKVFSGALSDFLGRRKFILILGYSLAALTKPIFPLASSVSWVFTARFVDRLGKGIRGAPRDALVADITQPHQRGAAYGLRQALDSVGALLGPLCALGLMIWFGNDIRMVMWIAAAPAFVAVAVLVRYVREPERPGGDAPVKSPLVIADVKGLPRRYWGVVLLGVVFTLGRFSEAFLVLRAQDVGLGLGSVPLVMVVMNFFYAGAAYPAGVAGDHVGPRGLLFFGLILLFLADLVLAVAGSPLVVFGGAALWGLHLAFTQGLLAKLVAETVPAELRGTGFGIFNSLNGFALLVASVMAGVLWSAFGPAVTFLAGAGFAAVAIIGMSILSLYLPTRQHGNRSSIDTVRT